MRLATTPQLTRKETVKMANEEFIMEEVLTKNYGTPTQITDKDMLMPIEDIMNEQDDIYDDSWEPSEEACKQMAELAECDDAEFDALVAAGGFDRNRGNAEELRQYWTRGKGAAKIRWGTPGDWARCVRHLEKYMGPRAKGYCQLRHKETTGVYTGSHLNPGHKNNSFSSAEEFTDSLVSAAQLRARAADARERVQGITASAGVAGAKFSIPLVIPENMESGDGRKFDADSIVIRELPLPLLWQIKTGEGHNGSVVVGRIDYMERTENGIGNAYGVFDTGPYGREAQRLVENGFIRGVSADLDQFEATEEDAKPKDSENADSPEEIAKKKLTINHARVMAATIVAKPAFQECVILIPNDISTQSQEDDLMTPEDGVYEESVASDETFNIADALVASGFLSSEVPVTPPTEWFEKPNLTKATPLTIDPDGRVYGHIAAWHVNHIGMPRSTRPPRSKSKYAYFHTGVVRTDSGKDIPVGQLTLAGGHASLQADAQAAAKHYDDTASAIADVHAGEDDYGIYVAGCLRPDATEAQIRALRASAPSGDWRPINGSLELVAVCQVNVPGFPIARAMVASGKVMALVAAGASEMAILKSQAFNTLAMKADMFNQLGASSTALLEYAESKFGYIPKAKREDLAKKGVAMEDGSFPIRNVADLKNAIQAHGRAKDVEAAKKHIIKRARALKKYDLIPEEWRKPKTVAASAAVEGLRQRALTAAAVAELAKFSDEERKHLAREGAAMPDGSFPIRNVDDLKNAIHAYGRANKSERVAVRKHIVKRARKLGADELIPETWKNAGSAEATASIERMRAMIASITEFAQDKEISDADLKKLADAKAAADEQTKEEIAKAKAIKEGKFPEEAPVNPQDTYDENGRTAKYTPKTQPRDDKGKYRDVLARLKQNLGVAGLQDALNKAQAAEDLDFAGNYTDSAKASQELLTQLDRLDSGALNSKSLANVKTTAAELGKVIANLPLPFGVEADKLRFSDLPAGLKNLVKDMITRVESKIGKKDGQVATKDLKSYMSGADVYSQAEIQSQMNKLLRLLT
jgi:hypothetical protein